MATLISEVKTLLENKLPEDWTKDAISFLERDFSPRGQVFVASLFVYMKEANKTLDEVLAALEEQWEKTWNFQHPDIKGDPDAPGAGIASITSLADIHQKLGVPLPRVAPGT